MKLPAQQTEDLVKEICNICAQFVAGQRLVRRRIDVDTGNQLHSGHVKLADGIDALYHGQPLEDGLRLVTEGYQALQQGYELAEKSVITAGEVPNTESNGLALMKDALKQLEGQLEIFQPLLKDIRS